MRILFTLLAMIASVVAFWLIARDLIPPKSMTLAAGGRDGGYWQVAEKYRTILARDGIQVTILETAGSGQNAVFLAEGRADAALLQGGVAAPQETEALAALFHEPLFIFVRDADDVPANPGQWDGLRIASGAPGSGTRIAVNQFLDVTGSTDNNTLLPIGGSAGAQALMDGQADIALFVAPLSAPYLTPLFENSQVQLLSADHIAAIEGQLPYSLPVTLPAGAVDLDPLQPPRDVQLLAMTARLVGQATLHPSLVDRLIEAAKEIHGKRDPITRDGTFPSIEGLTMPVDVYAGDLLRNGTSNLQAFLPYWVVAQINRVAILLLPVLLLTLPLVRVLPGLYAWRMRSRVFRHYQALADIDSALPKALADDLPQMILRLDDIDRDLAQVRLPLPYRNYAYSARLHVDLLKRRIADRQHAAARAP